MPSYSYKAFDPEGSIQSGYINADSERSARKEIKSLNLIPHKLKKIKSQTTKRYKIKNKDLVLATRQIGTLLEAAAQIDEALKMTAEQVKNKDLENILFNYVKEEGSSLIMVTHDQKLADKAKRKIKIKDGKIK